MLAERPFSTAQPGEELLDLERAFVTDSASKVAEGEGEPDDRLGVAELPDWIRPDDVVEANPLDRHVLLLDPLRRGVHYHDHRCI